jgi:hypothetical protein
MVVQPATAVIIDIQSASTALPTISVAAQAGRVVINYVGALLSSTNVSGPYMPVSNATTPYIIPATNAQQFYRSEAN